MFEEFFKANRESANLARKWKKKTGRKIIGVMPEYFPSEVITALGAYPVHFRGTQMPLSRSDTYMQSFSCTTTRTILEQALNGEMDYVDAFVFTTMCDNQQNLAEVFKNLFPDKPVIIFLIPFISSVTLRQEHLKEQIDRSISELERVTGNKFTKDGLKKALMLHERLNTLINNLYDIRRRNPGALSAYEFYSIVKAGSFLPPEEYTGMLGPVVKTLGSMDVKDVADRVIISGITPEPLELTKAFDEIGLHIVDDDLTSGTRRFSKGALKGTDAKSLDNFVFGGSPCSTLFDPSKDRRSYLLDKARSNRAGVIMWQIKFCEPEAFERPDITSYLKENNIPVTSFEVELQMASFEGIKTRLQAFKELMEVQI